MAPPPRWDPMWQGWQELPCPARHMPLDAPACQPCRTGFLCPRQRCPPVTAFPKHHKRQVNPVSCPLLPFKPSLFAFARQRYRRCCASLHNVACERAPLCVAGVNGGPDRRQVRQRVIFFITLLNLQLHAFQVHAVAVVLRVLKRARLVLAKAVHLLAWGAAPGFGLGLGLPAGSLLGRAPAPAGDLLLGLGLPAGRPLGPAVPGGACGAAAAGPSRRARRAAAVCRPRALQHLGLVMERQASCTWPVRCCADTA